MPLIVPLARRTEQFQAPKSSLVAGPASEVAASARTAAAAALDRGETHYTDRPGLVPLRRAVAAALSAWRDPPLSERDVVITCGVTEARFVAIQRLLPMGAGTVVALGHRERLEGACIIRDVALVGPDAEVDGDVVVYVPSDVDPAALSRWLDAAAEHRWPIVHEPGALHDAPIEHGGIAELTATIGDLAAPYGADAWRVGYLAAPKVVAGPLFEFKRSLTLCTTNVSQWGVLALLEGDG
jgi:aspartate aminotransferase